jgi:pimeloyl-ACP methyl ester carboxylesterase
VPAQPLRRGAQLRLALDTVPCGARLPAIFLAEENTTRRILQGLAISLAVTVVVGAQPSLPADFKQRTVDTPDGAQIYVRSGGAGPAVLLIHGFGDAGELWGPVARELVKTHTVVIPDLRGMGRSSHPAGGYDKRTQAADLRAVMLALGHDRSAVVGHDIGNMVAYAYAARYPDKVERLIVMDAPIPGIDPWDAVKCSPQTWALQLPSDIQRWIGARLPAV